MTTTRIATLFVFVFMAVSCASNPPTKAAFGPSTSEPSSEQLGADMPSDTQILEIAVRKVKPDRLAEFKAKRSAFIEYLKTLDGVVTDGEFEVKLSGGLTGPPDTESIIYVGMTTWASKELFDKAAQAVGSSSTAGELFATFDFLSYGQYQPTDGKPIALDELLAAGYLELPIRTIANGVSESEFGQKREELVALLRKQNGFIDNREFGSLADDGTLVGVVLWRSGKNVQDAFPTIIESSVAKVFFPMMDFTGYFQMIPTTNQ